MKTKYLDNQLTSFLILVFLIFPNLLNSQNSDSRRFMIGPNGKHHGIAQDVKAIDNRLGVRMREPAPSVNRGGDLFDLRWADRGDVVNFGFSTTTEGTGGDSIAQWMVPLGDAKVHKLMLYIVDFEGYFEFFLNKSNYNGEADIFECVEANGWVGKYDASGNWVPGENECFSQPPIGEEIWPKSASGIRTNITSDHANSWVEIDLSSLGASIPDVGSDNFFINGHAVRTANWGIGALNDAMTPYHSFKYYGDEENPGGAANKPGWVIRAYSWELYAIVEYYTDIPPIISNVTSLGTVLSSDPRTVSANVTDYNPGGGAVGISSATLHYTIDWWEEHEVPMTLSGDAYTGTIPGQSHTTHVDYYVSATDVEGNTSTSRPHEYRVFVPSAPVLLVDNQWVEEPDLWFNQPIEELYGISIDYDLWEPWSYGRGTYDLFKNYDIIIEMGTPGLDVCSDTSGLASWLNEGNKNLIITGDDWFWVCIKGETERVTFKSGDFAWDYLGIGATDQDFQLDENDDSWQEGIARMNPIENNAISGELYSFLNTNNLVLNHDPGYETGYQNWIDGVELRDSNVNVAFKTYKGQVDALTGAVSDEIEHITGIYSHTATGSKVAFFGFDVRALNTSQVGSAVDHSTGYNRIRTTKYSPIVRSLDWMKSLPPSSFELVYPYDNTVVEITRQNNWADTLYFAWEPSVDPHGGDVVYRRELSGDLLNFALMTNNHMTSNMYKIPFHHIEHYMHTEGIESATGTWTVIADGGSKRTYASNGPITLTIDASSVSTEESGIIPDVFALHANYPNPFNPSTAITYDLPEAATVHLVIYDVLGRQVRTLVNDDLTAGYHRAVWDATDDIGKPLSAGLYIYRIKAGSYSKTMKMVLLK